MSFSISSPSTTWYPASGCRRNYDGSLINVGNYGGYWSASPLSFDSYYAYGLYFSDDENVNPSYYVNRTYGYSVRCVRE